MRFMTGFVLGVIVCIAAPLLALRLGIVDMAALPQPGPIESFVGNLAYDSWIAHAAPRQRDPFDGNAAAIAVGFDHYRENCLGCHGAPDIKPGELAEGLHPGAPKLWEDSEEMTDGELFWTIRQGVRMTGMPAFAPTHTDEEIWKIVAFVRHLPHLSPEEKTQLQSAMEGEEAHHEGAE